LKGTKGVLQKDGHPIGFCEWDLDSLNALGEKMNEALLDVMREGLKMATEEYDVWASFRLPEDGPLLVRVGLPVGPSDCEDVYWEFPLAGLVDESIAEDNYGLDDKDDINVLTEYHKRLRDELRSLADRIDEAISRHL
jgi:hypothetical protein